MRLRAPIVASGLALLFGALWLTLDRRTNPFDAGPRDPETGALRAAVNAGADAGAASFPCPPHTLPDRGFCIPVPPELSQRDPTRGTLRLSLLPGRDPDYAHYETPIAGKPAQAAHDGRGLFVPAPSGTPVSAIRLEAQHGPSERLPSTNPSIALLSVHHVTRGGATRSYLLGYEGIRVAAPARGASRKLEPGAPVGEVVDTPATTSGLRLWSRQLRQGVDPNTTAPERLLLDSHSLECDPRNVLEPKRAELPAPSRP